MSDNANRDPRVLEAIKHAVDLDSTGKTDLAVQHLSALIEELPKASALHGYLAMFLASTGQFEQALEHGRQAVSLSPESEKASFFYFNALWRAGKHIEALDEMKRLLSIKPSQLYSQMIKEWDLSEVDQQKID